MTRLAIWWHRKRNGHHTLTYPARTVVVRCQGCPKEWLL